MIKRILTQQPGSLGPSLIQKGNSGLGVEFIDRAWHNQGLGLILRTTKKKKKEMQIMRNLSFEVVYCRHA